MKHEVEKDASDRFYEREYAKEEVKYSKLATAIYIILIFLAAAILSVGA